MKYVPQHIVALFDNVNQLEDNVTKIITKGKYKLQIRDITKLSSHTMERADSENIDSSNIKKQVSSTQAQRVLLKKLLHVLLFPATNAITQPKGKTASF